MRQTVFFRKGHRPGAAAVEFALVFPVFVATFLFLFEAWRFMQLRQAVDHAALEAARAAIVPGAVAEEAAGRGLAFLKGLGAGTAEVTVEPDRITEQTRQVTVDASLALADAGLLFRYFAPDSVLRSSITLDHENARIGRLASDPRVELPPDLPGDDPAGQAREEEPAIGHVTGGEEGVETAGDEAGEEGRRRERGDRRGKASGRRGGRRGR